MKWSQARLVPHSWWLALLVAALLLAARGWLPLPEGDLAAFSVPPRATWLAVAP